jgi:hypothetical protein
MPPANAWTKIENWKCAQQDLTNSTEELSNKYGDQITRHWWFNQPECWLNHQTHSKTKYESLPSNYIVFWKSISLGKTILLLGKPTIWQSLFPRYPSKNLPTHKWTIQQSLLAQESPVCCNILCLCVDSVDEHSMMQCEMQPTLENATYATNNPEPDSHPGFNLAETPPTKFKKKQARPSVFQPHPLSRRLQW